MGSKMAGIEFNCDLGEYDALVDGEIDAAIMPMIGRCNIACGGHAGNASVIRQTMQLAEKHGVKIGAHPSYPDREGFGRQVMDLNSTDLRQALAQQLTVFYQEADALGLTVEHLKPHGGLYNQAMVDDELAKALVELTLEQDAGLTLLGLPDSALQQAALRSGIKFMAEGFLDRHYQANGQLQPRTESNALLTDPAEAVQRLLNWEGSGQISAWDGSSLPMPVETWCVHGDSPNAVSFMIHIHKAMG